MAATRDWSKIPPDFMQLLFEHLTHTDFKQAKAVCSVWYSASRPCIPRQDPFPWLILFPQDGNTCLLFSPKEDKVYITKNLGNDIAKSRFLASSCSWLLFLDPRSNFYLLNPFTSERIDLPPCDTLSTQNLFPSSIKAVLWIDERTKDYLVVWRWNNYSLAFCRKGDGAWKEIPRPSHHRNMSGYTDMVYKNNKLYTYAYRYCINVFDFSGDFPKLIEVFDVPRFYSELHFFAWDTFIAVTTSGDVLLVAKKMIDTKYETESFNMYRIKAEETEWKRIDSLGGEALILDQRITIPTKGIRGIKKNSIYFSHDPTRSLFRTSLGKRCDIGVFNCTTKKIERFRQFDCFSRRFQNALWFFPGVGER